MKMRFMIISLVLVFLNLQTPLIAKELKPFECMQPYLLDDWGGSHKEQATVFNKERDRLGKSFVPELMKFIDENVESHYWVSLFITNDYYLQNHASMNELGLLIMELGLILCEKDEKYAFNAVAFHVCAAVLAQKMSLNTIAAFHKNKGNSMVENKPIYAAGWPALDDVEREIFDSI